MRDFLIFSCMTKSFRTIIFLLAVPAFLSCNLGQKSTGNSKTTEAKQIANPGIEISESSIRENLEYLASNELRGRETGTEGIELAAQFIEEKFEKAGIKPFYQTYRDSFEVKERTGYNIIGYLEGTDDELKDEYIILGAHYDHIGLGKVVDGDSIANGANDNAAGTVAVLELAKYLGDKELNKRSLLFALFSAEEMGLVGAKYAASNLKAKGIDLYAMVNFEMIGVPMEGKDFMAYLTGYENSNFAEKFNEYAGENLLGFLPEAKQYNLFQRSDNYPFYQEFNVPAQTISTFDFTNYEYYHHVSDEAHRMNTSHMARLIEDVIPAIVTMANTPEKEIKMNKE